MNEPTLCKNCDYFVNREPTGPRKDVWYNHICTAPEAQRPEKMNFVNGHMEREETNCREVNNGACQHFKKAVLPVGMRSYLHCMFDRG